MEQQPIDPIAAKLAQLRGKPVQSEPKQPPTKTVAQKQAAPVGSDPISAKLAQMRGEQPVAETPPFPQAPPQQQAGGGAPSTASVTPQAQQPLPSAPATEPPPGGYLKPFRGTPEDYTQPERKPQFMPVSGVKKDAKAGLPTFGPLSDDERKQAESILFTYRNDFTPQAVEEKKRAKAALEGEKAAEEYMAEELGRLASIEMPKKKQLLEGSKQGFLADQKSLDVAITDLNGFRAQLEQQAAANPELAPQLQEQYNLEVGRVQAMQQDLKNQATQLEKLAADIDRDQLYVNFQDFQVKSRQGGFAGATWNNLLNNVGTAVSGVNSFLFIEPLLKLDPPTPRDGETQEQANDRVRKLLRTSMREAPLEAIGSEGTTPEFLQKKQEEFLYGAWLAATGTAPLAMMGPGGIGMIASAADNTMQEMEGEKFADVPEWKKQLFSGTVGAVVGLLEKKGLQQAIDGGPLARQILSSVFSKAPQNATTSQIKALIAAETESALANAGSRVFGAMAVEGATELQQGLVEPGLKELFNMAEGKDLFKTPKTFGDLVDDVVRQTLQGAIGGAIYGTPNAVKTYLKDAKVGATANNTQFEVAEELLRDPQFALTLQNDLKRQVEAAKISEVEAQETIAAWKGAQQIASKIPGDLDTETRRKAFDLLTQKAKLSKLEKPLVGEKIAAIDQKLMELAGTQPKETAEGEAKPKPTATEEEIQAAIAPPTPDPPQAPLSPDEGENWSMSDKERSGRVLAIEQGSAFKKMASTVRGLVGDNAIVSGTVQSVSDERYWAASGDVFHHKDGGFTFIGEGHVLKFDKDGNLLRDKSTIPDKQLNATAEKRAELEALRNQVSSIESSPLKTTKRVTNIIGDVVDVPLTERELAESRKKREEYLSKSRARIKELEQELAGEAMNQETPPTSEVEIAQTDGATATPATPTQENVIQERTDKRGRTTKVIPVVGRLTDKDGNNDYGEKVTFGVIRDGREITGSGFSYNSVQEFLDAHPEVSEEADIEQLREADQDLGITRIVVTEHRFDSKTGKGSVSINVITELGQMEWNPRATGPSPWSKQDGATATPTTPTQETVIQEGVPPASEGDAGVAEGQVGAEDGRQPSQTSVPESLTESPAPEAPKPATAVAKEPTTPPSPPPPAGPKAPKEEGRPMRATAKRVIEQFPELENVLTDDAVYYNRMPHKVSLDAAKAIVEQRGLENAARDIMEGADMPGAVRSMLGRVIMETYRKEGKLEQLADFSEKWFDGITNAAQAISALQTLYGDIYDKEAILFKAQKMVREQRIKQEKAAEQTTRKLIKGLREVNKEAINETLGKVSVRGHITKASTPKKQASEPRKPRYGEKNRIVTKSAYEAALREMRSQMFSAIIPPQLVVMTAYHIEAGARSFAEVAEQLTKDLGRKALPYLKEAYNQASKRLKSEGLEFEQTPDNEIDEYVWKRQAAKIVEKFDAAVKKGDAKAQRDAIAALQEIAKEEGVWGEYKKYAADRLKRLSEQQIKKDVDADPYLMEFTRGLVANISQQIRDLDPDGKPSKKPARTSIEIIGDAFKNPEKYKEAWEETRKQFADELRGAKAELTKATESGDKERIAKAEARVAEREAKAEALDNYFGEFLPKPFSDALVAKAVSQGLKDLDIKIADIVRKHYTVQEGKKRDLIDKLVQDAGLDGAEAAELAKAVGGEFDRIATEKKRQIIAKAFPVGERKKPSVRGVEQSLIELTNAGAFSDADVVKRYGDSMGFAKLTAEQISTIEGLADAIQRAPEGRPKWEAVQDLLDYQASIKGMTKWELAQSVWYANVLSGPETQSKNFIAGFFKSIGEYTVASSLELVARRSPETTRDLASSLFWGLRKGWLEAGSVMRTGRSPIRSHKVEASATLERLADDPSKFISSMAKGLGKLKYVRRAMESVDTIFYEGTREMRAYQWAVRKARGNPNPSMTIREQALEYMNAGNVALQQAQDQAAMEAQSLIDELDGELDKKAITKTEYDKRVKVVRLNERRRVFELVERGRPEDINEEASRFGSFATYNYVPNGTLGAIASGVNQILAKFPPLRLVIPFTNVITNVANDALDWTPVGALRSRTRTGSIGASTVEAMFDADRAKALAAKLDPEQLEQYKEDQLARAIIGTTAMAAIFMLTQPGDDDEEPALTITGNGYGDPRKNQQLRETGWQPYSIKIGDTWISYQYSPLIMAFGMIGHLRDAEKYRKKKIDDTAMSNVFAAMSYAPTTFFDLSFLSGLSKSLSAATDPRSEEKVKALGEWATRSAKSFVVPNLYTQGHRIYQSIAEEPNKDVRDSLVGQLLKDVPFVRDMYPNAYNILGEPIVPYSTSLVSIENDDPVFSLFASKNWMQGLPATPPVYDPAQKKDRVMTPEERAVFYKERGEYIRKVVENNMDQLRKLDGEKFDRAMRSITSKATKRAKGKIVLGADYEPE